MAIQLKVLFQKPYQETMMIHGQEIALPFTNMYCAALFEKENGKWNYVCREGGFLHFEKTKKDLIRFYRAILNEQAAEITARRETNELSRDA